MAKLTGQTIASSYDQLLIVTGANGITSSLQAVESGDTDGASSALKIATNKVEVIPASDDANAFEVSNAAGVAQLTVATNTPALTVGADGTGADVIFYSGTAGDNFTWDASEEKLTITGTNGQVALAIPDGNVTITDDLDVDGTTNLDVVDIDGAVNMAADLTMGANILMADDTSIGISDSDERIEFDASGDISVLGANFGIGTSSPASILEIRQDVPNIRIDSYNTTAGNASDIQLRRSNHGTLGTHTAVDADDALGKITFMGSDSNSFEVGAQIKGTAAETWVNGAEYGTYLTFHTTDIGTTTLDERMRINDAGNVTFCGPKNNSSSSDVDNYAITWGGDNTTSARWGLRVASSNEHLHLDGNLSGTPFTAMTWDKLTKNVGIGDTDPSEAKLSIDSVASGDHALKVVQAQNTEAVYIDNNGTNTALSIENTGSAGRGLYMYTSNGASQNEALVNLVVDDGAFDQALMAIDNDATGANTIFIDAEATSGSVIQIEADALTTGSAGIFYTNSTGLASTNAGGLVEIISANDTDANVNNLLFIQNDHADSGGTVPLWIDQDANAVSIYVDTESTSHGLYFASPGTTTGRCILVNDADALTTGSCAYFHSNSDSNGSRNLVHIHNQHTSSTATTGLFIDQDANYRALTISAATTTENTLLIDTPATTSGVVFNIAELDAITSGKAINVDCGSTALATTASGGLVEIKHDANSGGTANNLLFIRNDHASSSGTKCLSIDQDANQSSIFIDSESTTADIVSINGDPTTDGTCFRIDADGLEDGSIALFESNSDDNSSRNLVQIINDHASATGTTGLKIQQDSTAAKAIDIAGGWIAVANTSLDTGAASFYGQHSQHTKTAGATTNSHDITGFRETMYFNDGDTYFGALAGLKVYTNSQASAGESESIYGGYFNTAMGGSTDVGNMYGQYNLVDIDAGTVDANVYGQYTSVDVDGGTITGDIYGIYISQDSEVDPSGSSFGLYIRSDTNQDNAIQTQDNSSVRFRVSDDGVVTSEGAMNASTGMDYAEYFESKDGKEIAIGSTVKLDGTKIVACSDGDTPIGVIRPVNTSSVVAGGQEFHWESMFMKDDYGADVFEDYTLKKWSVEITHEEYIKRGKDETGGVMSGRVKDEKVEGSKEVLYKEGDELPEGKEVGDVKEAAVADTYFREHKYHSDRLPEGVTAPDDAETISPSNKRQKLNPDYDDSKEYKSREERDEWHIVGLLGQIPITKGQPTGNWIKMKDVSDTVEMYFVK